MLQSQNSTFRFNDISRNHRALSLLSSSFDINLLIIGFLKDHHLTPASHLQQKSYTKGYDKMKIARKTTFTRHPDKPSYLKTR